jgi:apoptosis-inducing factor 2
MPEKSKPTRRRRSAARALGIRGVLMSTGEGSDVNATVAVIGGGYGGIAAAKALDDDADVVLIEAHDTFVHNVAALRAVTDPDWIERMFIPYDGLLARGQLRRDRAVRVSSSGLWLASGDQVAADFVILATGSTHRYPAKIDTEDAASGREKLLATHRELSRASHVLLAGAGPVGLEFAGEIAAAWPGKAITIVEPSRQLMPGRFPEEFRELLRAQLDQLGVELRLGTSLRELPPARPGEAGTFTVTTTAGQPITADIWFPCYGSAPATGYLAADLSTVRRPGGLIAVTPELRLPGQRAMFAVGDITAIPEMKMARNAKNQAEVVAANIKTLITGRGSMTSYAPHVDAIVLPLGPKGGVTYAPEVGVLGADRTSDIKGDLFVATYREFLGAPPVPPCRR